MVSEIPAAAGDARKVAASAGAALAVSYKAGLRTQNITRNVRYGTIFMPKSGQKISLIQATTIDWYAEGYQ
jgi:hypothetical protein